MEKSCCDSNGDSAIMPSSASKSLSEWIRQMCHLSDEEFMHDLRDFWPSSCTNNSRDNRTIDRKDPDFDGFIDENGEGTGCLSVRQGHSHKQTKGNIVDSRFHGLVREIVPDRFITQVHYVRGERIPSTHRRFRTDGMFVELKIGRHYWRRLDGGAFLFGKQNDAGEFEGDGCVYLFPGLSAAIAGRYANGRLASGKYGKVTGVRFDELGMARPVVSVGEEDLDDISYDPSTWNRISKNPVSRDPYESEHCSVGPSTLGEEAGEGLFAKKDIPKGRVISLFNGIRMDRVGRSGKTISPDSDDWSDYRLTLDRDTDLDIPDECISTSSYSATLGHKACHSFGEAKNARFDNLYHPRFGRIMSVVSTRDVAAGEEVFVSYNYAIALAPKWYQDLWEKHQRNLVET